jgi:lysophospholipase L1-like esterase
VLVVLPVVVLAGCGGRSVDTVTAGSSASPTTSVVAGPVRVLVLGDSFAVGEGIEPDGAWPAQLATMLQAEGYDAEVTIIGDSGWTSRRVAGAFDRVEPGDGFGLVFVAVGVNDHFYQFSPGNLEAAVRRILDRANRLVDDPADVVVLSIVDWRATPRGMDYAGTWRDTAVTPYNDVLEELAAAGGHRFLDVTTPSRAMAAEGSLVAGDGLHGSAQLYALWTEQLVPIALDALGS